MDRTYVKEDIAMVLEMRREVLQHLEKVEMYLWTDNLKEASVQTIEMHRIIANLHDLKMKNHHENAVNNLFEILNAKGIHIQMVNFPHKKTE